MFEDFSFQKVVQLEIPKSKNNFPSVIFSNPTALLKNPLMNIKLEAVYTNRVSSRFFGEIPRLDLQLQTFSTEKAAETFGKTTLEKSPTRSEGPQKVGVPQLTTS